MYIVLVLWTTYVIIKIVPTPPLGYTAYAGRLIVNLFFEIPGHKEHSHNRPRAYHIAKNTHRAMSSSPNGHC